MSHRRVGAAGRKADSADSADTLISYTHTSTDTLHNALYQQQAMTGIESSSTESNSEPASYAATAHVRGPLPISFAC